MITGAWKYLKFLYVLQFFHRWEESRSSFDVNIVPPEIYMCLVSLGVVDCSFAKHVGPYLEAY